MTFRPARAMGVFDDGYGEALYVPTEVPAAYAPPPGADAAASSLRCSRRVHLDHPSLIARAVAWTGRIQGPVALDGDCLKRFKLGGVHPHLVFKHLRGVYEMASIRYFVTDVDAAIAFYTEKFGFKLKQKMSPAFAYISKDDLTLWLSGPQSSAARPMPDGRRPEAGGWNRLVIEVKDLPARVAQMKQAGVHFRNDIVVGPGGKQILAEDPDGNPVELFEPAQ